MKMTVKDLRDALKGLPDDRPVILYGDAEGNRCSQLAEVDPECSSVIRPDDWEIDTLHPDDVAEYANDPNLTTAVLLMPVN